MVSAGRCAHISDGNIPWGISQTSLILDPLLSENTLGFVFQGTHLGECWFREWFPYKSGFLRKPPQIRNTRINQTNRPLSLSLNMVTELHRNSWGSTLGWGHKVQGARPPGLGGPAGLWITVLPWCMPESREFQPRRLTFFKWSCLEPCTDYRKSTVGNTRQLQRIRGSCSQPLHFFQ